MKKVLALVLSLCMLLSCAAYAESGITGQLKVDVQGQTQADYTFSLAQDEDGCLQLSLNGNGTDVFAQIGKEAAVIGSNGEFAQINYQELLAALQNALPQALTEEQMMAVSVIYYLFTGLEGDLQIASEVLSNELTRLLGIGMQQGVITYSREGLVIEANEDQLLALVKAYVAALAQDPTALAKLSQTQLWSLLKLSENGVQEQSYLTALNEQVASLELPEAISLYVKAVIGMDDSFTLDVDFENAESTEFKTLNIDAAVKEGTAEFTVAATSDYGDNVNLTANIGATEDGAATATCNVTVTNEEDGVNMTMNSTATVSADGKIVSDTTLKLDSYISAEMEEHLIADTAAKEISWTLDGTMGAEGQQATISADFAADETNGLYASLYVTDPDGVRNGLSITGNAQTNEYGAQANLNMDLVVDGQPIDGIFTCEAVLSDVIDIHAHLNSIRSDVDVQYNDKWSSYTVRYNDLFSGRQYTYASKDEYEANPDSYAEGLYNIFNLDASLNLENAKLDAALTYEGHTLALEGAASADAYTLIATADGEVIATAVQQLLPGQPVLNSLLLGQLTVELYNGIKVVRTTKVADNTVSWLFTVTNANGETQEIEVGIRNKSDADTQNYELFLAAQGMEYDVGVVFEQSSEKIFVELYLNMVSGGFNMNYLDATLTLQPITEAPAHVTGQPIPQSYLEQLLVSVLSQISRELDRAF